MPRVQSIVVRDRCVLMVKHRHDDVAWWCLPGGGLEPGETPAQGALRELREECNVGGAIVRQTAHVCCGRDDETISFLVDIGDQNPSLGHDPEFAPGEGALVDVQWLRLDEIPERDRAFLWAAGLLGVAGFFVEVERWGDSVSYPVGDESAGEATNGEADREAVARAERLLADAHLTLDIETIDRLLHRDYQIVQPGGTVETKAAVLASYGTGSRHWETAQVDQLDVRVFGDTATVIGRWRASGRNGGERFNYVASFLSVWVRQDGRWQNIAYRATEIAEDR